MRNYVIINGVNSLTIQGLAINNLPPITKPMIRTQREEIDGRDGDIVTELGYSAYDKQMEIGLYGNFDIDAIIKYFTGEGTIVFSNEADKYYNFKILDQIDYEKLLKFKTAVVTFHCQPFKYPTSETPLEEAYEYVEATGTDLTLNNTEETIFNKFDLIGNTYQDSTTGKNLFDESLMPTNTMNGIKWEYANNKIKISGTATSSYSQSSYTNISLPAGTYYFVKSGTTSLNFNAWFYNTGGTLIANTKLNNPFTISESATRLVIFVEGIVNGTSYNQEMDFMVSTTNGEYEPYTGGIPAPNPDFPEDIHVVSGNNIIKVCGKNLYNDNFDDYTQPVNYRICPIDLEIGQTYTLKAALKGTSMSGVVAAIVPYGNQYVDFSTVLKTAVDSQGYVHTITFTPDSTWTSPKLVIYASNETTFNNIFTNYEVQLEKSSTATEYEKYQDASYPISLGNIEMCSIPNTDYKDAFVHDDNKWYKLAKVGKMLLNGTENWQKTNDTVASVFTLDTSSIYPLAKYTQPGKGLSNYFILAYKNKDGSIYFSAQNRVVLVRDTSYTLETFKTWLSSHNTTVYYVLKNQSQTEITDETLKSQLDDLWENATSYKGQTNITQTNNDMPFILDVSALKDGSDHLIIDNIGTAYSKPTIDIEGTGIVDIYLNDEQIFEIDLTTQNEIIIDTEKMEAYTPDNLLANRLVTGDYSNFKLAPGENDLRFSGDLTKATVTRYIRWI